MQRSGARLAAALAATAALACAPQPEEPEGALLTARTADLRVLLERLARLEGTPLGEGAAALAARLPDCPAVEARAPEADPRRLLAGLRCSDAARKGGSRDITLVWPLAEGEPLRARLRLDPAANGELELELPGSLAEGALGLALPGRQAPGPGVLSSADTLLHARVRPTGGIDLSRMVAADGQASRMFRLKSRLFAGAVLDGSWESVIYLPGESDALPPVALALGFHARAPAVAAMEQFIAELTATWPILRAEFALGESQGACLPGLRILPDFAPCYVATRDALVVGWNAASVARALREGGARLGSEGGLVVDLARFAEADERIAAQADTTPQRPAQPPPWQRLQASGRATDDGVHLRVRLQAERDA